jgi:hypothetical protein
LVRAIERTQVYFHFVLAAAEDGRAAARAEVSTRVVVCFAFDRYGICRKYRGRMKERSVMLAAVEAMTDADPIWTTGRH